MVFLEFLNLTIHYIKKALYAVNDITRIEINKDFKKLKNTIE